MNLRIAQHYLHPKLGPVKFEGYWGVHLLFSTYERLSRNGKYNQAFAGLALTKPDIDYALSVGSFQPVPPPA